MALHPDVATDPRILSLQALPTAEKLMAGELTGIVRAHSAARICRVPWNRRQPFYDWLTESNLLIAPFSVFWHLDENCGCLHWEELRKAITAALQAGQTLPFEHGCRLPQEVTP